jgi:hypothetical protein
MTALVRKEAGAEAGAPLRELSADHLHAMTRAVWRAREQRAAVANYPDLPATARAALLEAAEKLERDAVNAREELERRLALLPRITHGRLA